MCKCNRYYKGYHLSTDVLSINSPSVGRQTACCHSAFPLTSRPGWHQYWSTVCRCYSEGHAAHAAYETLSIETLSVWSEYVLRRVLVITECRMEKSKSWELVLSTVQFHSLLIADNWRAFQIGLLTNYGGCPECRHPSTVIYCCSCRHVLLRGLLGVQCDLPESAQ